MRFCTQSFDQLLVLQIPSEARTQEMISRQKKSDILYKPPREYSLYFCNLNCYETNEVKYIQILPPFEYP